MMPLVAWIGRPSTAWLAAATIFVIGGWGLHFWLEHATRPPVPPAGPVTRPEPPSGESAVEPPAVVALLTNGYQTPPSAVPGTVLDLSARHWLSLTASNSRLYVLTQTRPPDGDRLETFEQHVVGYLGSIAKNDAVSAGTLTRNRARLNRRWWQRFRGQVADAAQARGLTVDRYPASSVFSVGAVGALGLFALLRGIQRSTDVAIADSWRSRGWWLVVLAALIGLLVATWFRYVDRAQAPTDLGHQRASAWVGYRSRLDSRIPETASVLGTPHQQRALADGVVTGVARTVYKQLPVVAESNRWAWSTAGGTAHTVRIRYPVRPGYGRHPLAVAAAGVVGFLATRLIRVFLFSVASGAKFGGITDAVPGGTDIIRGFIGSIAVLAIIPLLVSVWCVVAGAVDSLVVNQREGVVIKTQTPSEVLPDRIARLVQPLGRRSKYRTYLAVDTANHSTVQAWLAPASKVAPQRTAVAARVTPLLGYVHSCEPLANEPPPQPIQADATTK